MAELFGTDGVRGVANTELTPELALTLGRALVAVLRGEGHRRPPVVIGRDPRWSGDLLEAALVAGITSAGGDAVTVGVLPTPAVAFLVPELSAAAGAVISASHNPVADNGIKLFGPDGFKLDDDEQAEVQAHLEAGDGPRPTGTGVGRSRHDVGAAGRYLDHLVAAAEADLAGLRVVVDAAHGAASLLAPRAYRTLGAEVIEVGCRPDGANINEGVGSTHPAALSEAVVGHRADLGVAHDGDADRVVAAAADGTLVDGDVILAILARHRHQGGRLDGGAVATTIMTNLGFHRAMAALGIGVVQTPVGDRHVLAALRKHGLVLGGEQSGHILQLDEATTGDGLLTAVKLLSVVRGSGGGLADLSGIMERLPQVLVNVPVADREGLDGAPGIWEEVARVEAELGADGRVLVRPSGTEPVVRVMVEATTQGVAADAADRIAAAVSRVLGADDIL